MNHELFSPSHRRRLQMGGVGRRIRWLRWLPTSVCAVDTPMNLRVREQELRAKRADSEFLPSHDVRVTKPSMRFETSC